VFKRLEQGGTQTHGQIKTLGLMFESATLRFQTLRFGVYSIPDLNSPIAQTAQNHRHVWACIEVVVTPILKRHQTL
jgi:hypothetical protein